MACIVVRWTDEKYKGKEQAVPVRCVIDPKTIATGHGELQEGQEVKELGKSASARVWSGVYLRRAVVQQKPEPEAVPRPKGKATKRGQAAKGAGGKAKKKPKSASASADSNPEVSSQYVQALAYVANKFNNGTVLCNKTVS